MKSRLTMMPRFSHMYDEDGMPRQPAMSGPVPVPVPVGPPERWDGSKLAYAQRHWRFIQWQVSRERVTWPALAQAPFEISPEVQYVVDDDLVGDPHE